MNRLTATLAPAPRQYVRGRLIAAVDERHANGETVDAETLATLYQHVMNELEVALLETL